MLPDRLAVTAKQFLEPEPIDWKAADERVRLLLRDEPKFEPLRSTTHGFN